MGSGGCGEGVSEASPPPHIARGAASAPVQLSPCAPGPRPCSPSPDPLQSPSPAPARPEPAQRRGNRAPEEQTTQRGRTGPGLRPEVAAGAGPGFPLTLQPRTGPWGSSGPPLPPALSARGSPGRGRAAGGTRGVTPGGGLGRTGRSSPGSPRPRQGCAPAPWGVPAARPGPHLGQAELRLRRHLLQRAPRRRRPAPPPRALPQPRRAREKQAEEQDGAQRCHGAAPAGPRCREVAGPEGTWSPARGDLRELRGQGRGHGRGQGRGQGRGWGSP